MLPHPDGTIHYVDLSDSTTSSCGGATVWNTDRVDVYSAGPARLKYDEAYRRFAPGSTAEAGRDEIEFVLHGLTSVWLLAGDDAETLTLGADVIHADHLDTDLVVDGGSGTDSATLDDTDPRTSIENVSTP
jgi:hypothetical protein